eukprot:103517-Pelagomonas_calceolata.AAC.1
MLGSCSFQSGKGVGIREFKIDKVNIPVLKRDLSRIRMGGSARDRLQVTGKRRPPVKTTDG